MTIKSLTEVRQDTTKAVEVAQDFLDNVRSGEIREFVILANQADQWAVWRNTLDSFVKLSGCLFQALLHVSGVQFEVHSEDSQ